MVRQQPLETEAVVRLYHFQYVLSPALPIPVPAGQLSFPRYAGGAFRTPRHENP